MVGLSSLWVLDVYGLRAASIVGLCGWGGEGGVSAGAVRGRARSGLCQSLEGMRGFAGGLVR